MAWWISLLLLSMAALLWKKSCDSTDDVIALLERILATTLLLVVVLVSRNVLLETAVLIAAVQLPGVPRRPRQQDLVVRAVRHGADHGRVASRKRYRAALLAGPRVARGPERAGAATNRAEARAPLPRHERRRREGHLVLAEAEDRPVHARVPEPGVVRL